MNYNLEVHLMTGAGQIWESWFGVCWQNELNLSTVHILIQCMRVSAWLKGTGITCGKQYLMQHSVGSHAVAFKWVQLLEQDVDWVTRVLEWVLLAFPFSTCRCCAGLVVHQWYTRLITPLFRMLCDTNQWCVSFKKNSDVACQDAFNSACIEKGKRASWTSSSWTCRDWKDMAAPRWEQIKLNLWRSDLLDIWFVGLAPKGSHWFRVCC